MPAFLDRTVTVRTLLGFAVGAVIWTALAGPAHRAGYLAAQFVIERVCAGR